MASPLPSPSGSPVGSAGASNGKKNQSAGGHEPMRIPPWRRAPANHHHPGHHRHAPQGAKRPKCHNHHRNPCLLQLKKKQKGVLVESDDHTDDHTRTPKLPSAEEERIRISHSIQDSDRWSWTEKNSESSICRRSLKTPIFWFSGLHHDFMLFF